MPFVHFKMYIVWQLKKSPEETRWNKYLNRACREVAGFEALLERFQRNISILGRSPKTFENYSRHSLSAVADGSHGVTFSMPPYGAGTRTGLPRLGG